MSAFHDITTRVTPPGARPQAPSRDDCLVMIHTPRDGDLGKRFLLDRQVTSIGRDRDNTIVLPSSSVSRKHARVERGDHDVWLVDLQSTNGTYVNDELHPVTRVTLRRGDLIRVGDSIFKYLAGSDVETQYHETIFNMTVTDGLTQVGNLKALTDVLTREIPRARRYGRDLALLMIDLDYFKQVNDGHGHLAGDSVLRDLATVLHRRLRPDDQLARYGGEEFVVVLPETSAVGATKIAEDLRALVEARTFVVEGEKIHVTVSIGIGVLESGMDGEALLKEADRQLYAAKRAGRNRVAGPNEAAD